MAEKISKSGTYGSHGRHPKSTAEQGRAGAEQGPCLQLWKTKLDETGDVGLRILIVKRMSECECECECERECERVSARDDRPRRACPCRQKRTGDEGEKECKQDKTTKEQGSECSSGRSVASSASWMSPPCVRVGLCTGMYELCMTMTTSVQIEPRCVMCDVPARPSHVPFRC